MEWMCVRVCLDEGQNIVETDDVRREPTASFEEIWNVYNQGAAVMKYEFIYLFILRWPHGGSTPNWKHQHTAAQVTCWVAAFCLEFNHTAVSGGLQTPVPQVEDHEHEKNT